MILGHKGRNGIGTVQARAGIPPAFVGFPMQAGCLRYNALRHLICPTEGRSEYIEAAKFKSVYGKVFARYNLKDGKAYNEYSDAKGWLTHPTDPLVDVAVLPLGLGFPTEGDILYYPVERFATMDIIPKEGIGVGSNLFFPGLFTNHAGQDRIIPIVRAGNIAAMCEEKVKTKLGEIDAFLVEARSIGGLSGSPVFVSLSNPTPQGGYAMGRESCFYLLGLMHGHFDLPESKIDCAVGDAMGTGSINVGIGIVIPAEKIIEVLNHPGLVERRKKTAEEWRNNQVSGGVK